MRLVKFFLLFIIAITISACGGGGGKGKNKDATPPFVISTSPADSATNFAINSSITAQFSEDVAPATINADTFLISGTTGTVTYDFDNRIATFTPGTYLVYSTTYTATITTGVKDHAGNALAEDFTWSFTTGVAPDTSAPAVSSTSPANNATGVAVNAAITATFTEPVTNVSTTTFTLKNAGNNSPVSGTVNYSGTTATFTPAANLAHNTTYTATITTGVKDLAENALADNYSWSFTTGPAPDTTAPAVSSTSPANNATGTAVNNAITVTFSEPVANVSTTTFILKNANNNAVSGSVNYSGTTATFTPAANLAHNTTYTATITTGVKDLAENALAGIYSWSFTTGVAPDTTAPAVSSTSPDNNATGVAVNTAITATFTEPVTNLSTSTFTLKNAGNNAVSGSVNYSGTTATFTPSTNLAHNTTYTATISTGVKDLAGNALAANYSWNFTTGVAPDTTAPAVSSTSPTNNAAGVAVNAAISATFSEPVTNVSTTTFTLKNAGNNSSVSGTVNYSGTTATFTLAANLAYNTTYTATITTGVKDLAGNALAANHSWSFTTGAAPDTTPPEISSIFPTHDATAIAIHTAITATFSEPVTNVSTTTFTLKNAGNDSPISGTVNYSGTTATFSPAANLAYNTTYTATITTGVKDLAGNALAANYSWSFTTPMILAGTVSPLYPDNGVSWNYYVKNDGVNVLSASGTACLGTEEGGYSACIHGGEMRVFEVEELFSCAGLSATDALDAFDWTCDDSYLPVRFISTGLKEEKLLSDLINFSGAGAWKSNSVTVKQNGVAVATTPSTIWWSNPLVVDNDGIMHWETAAGTIYLVTDETAQGFYNFGPRCGLVIKPGVTLKGNGTFGSIITNTSTLAGFQWIEGQVNAINISIGIHLTGKFSVLRGVKVTNAGDCGLLLDDFASNNLIQRIVFSNNKFGIRLQGANRNTFSRITLADNSWGGLRLESSSGNSFTSVTAIGSMFNAINIESSTGNKLTNVFTANSSRGIQIEYSSNNTLAGITAANNGGGVYLLSSPGNTLSGVNLYNNNEFGIYLNVSQNNNLIGLTAANNGSHGIYLLASYYNNLGKLTAVNNNGSGLNLYYSHYNRLTDIATADNGEEGVYFYDCIDSNVNNLLENSLASSFAGKVTTNDTRNQSDTNGTASYPDGSADFDWVSFDNPYRGWGIDGSTFPNADHRGQWVSGTGRIWDWSIAAGDTIIRNVHPLPTGNDTITHTWSDSSATTFLRHAIELEGNGNGLCESGETCLYTPNIGSYQGHGELISAGTFTNGAIANVTLMKYQHNGR